MDPLMPHRALILLEFGCPPMPVAEGNRMETGEPQIVNSHDLLSVMLAQAFKKQDKEFNYKRRAQQEAIAERYRQNLLAAKGSAQAIYEAMAAYTRDYIGTYLLGPYSTQDVRVLPMDFVSPVLYDNMEAYRRALHIMHHGTDPTEASKNLNDLLRRCHGLLIAQPSRVDSSASSA